MESNAGGREEERQEQERRQIALLQALLSSSSAPGGQGATNTSGGITAASVASTSDQNQPNLMGQLSAAAAALAANDSGGGAPAGTSSATTTNEPPHREQQPPAAHAAPASVAGAGATSSSSNEPSRSSATIEALQSLIGRRHSTSHHIDSLQSTLGNVSASPPTPAPGTATTSSIALSADSLALIQSQLIRLILEQAQAQAQAQARARQEEQEQRQRATAISTLQALLTQNRPTSLAPPASSSATGTDTGTRALDSIIAQLRCAQSPSSQQQQPQQQPQQQQQQQLLSSLLQQLLSQQTPTPNLGTSFPELTRIASSSGQQAPSMSTENQYQQQINPGAWLIEQILRQQQQPGLAGAASVVSIPAQQSAGSTVGAGLPGSQQNLAAGVQQYPHAALAGGTTMIAQPIAERPGEMQMGASVNPSATANLKSTGESEEEDGDDESDRKRTTPRQESFPEKLYRLLMEVEAKGRDDIISFNAEGDSFEIHQPEVFEEEVIPDYFRHNKIGSFKRQLGLYGFKRISDGVSAGEFSHELFRKGQPDLCRRIKRRPKKASSSKSSGGDGKGTAA